MDSWLSWKLRRLDDRFGQGPPQRPPEHRPEDGPLVRSVQMGRVLGIGLLVIGVVFTLVEVLRARWRVIALVTGLIEFALFMLLWGSLLYSAVDAGLHASRLVDPHTTVRSPSSVVLRGLLLLAFLAAFVGGMEVAIPIVTRWMIDSPSEGSNALPFYGAGPIGLSAGLVTLRNARRLGRIEDRLGADVLVRRWFRLKPEGFYLRPRR